MKLSHTNLPGVMGPAGVPQAVLESHNLDNGFCQQGSTPSTPSSFSTPAPIKRDVQQHSFSATTASARKRRRGSALNLLGVDATAATEEPAETETTSAYDEEAPHGKRPRQSNGRLESSTPTADRSPSKRSCPLPRKSTPWRGQASRFLEGSMRDRESERPPSQYIGFEQAMEAYARDDEESLQDFDAGIERSARPSGMYRFGKALTNMFTPSAVWQGMSNIFKEKPDGIATSAEIDMLHDRRVKAEKAYAELKRSGFLGTGGNTSGSNLDLVRAYFHHGSAVNVDVHGNLAPNESIRGGSMVSELVEGTPLMASPPLHPSIQAQCDTTPSERRKASKSARHLRRPSLPTLRKMKSHLTLPSVKREHLSPPPFVPMEREDSAHRIKKKQSRKDLQKQHKLSKKISNLETQLEKARRELLSSMAQDKEAEEAVDTMEVVDEDTYESKTKGMVYQDIKEEGLPPDPLPTVATYNTRSRRSFVPGSLPTLPSERILHERALNTETSTRNEAKSLGMKSDCPDETVFVIERALGMHAEDENPMPRGRTLRNSLKKSPTKSAMRQLPAPKNEQLVSLKANPKPAFRGRKRDAELEPNRAALMDAISNDANPKLQKASQRKRKSGESIDLMADIGLETGINRSREDSELKASPMTAKAKSFRPAKAQKLTENTSTRVTRSKKASAASATSPTQQDHNKENLEFPSTINKPAARVAKFDRMDIESSDIIKPGLRTPTLVLEPLTEETHLLDRTDRSKPPAPSLGPPTFIHLNLELDSQTILHPPSCSNSTSRSRSCSARSRSRSPSRSRPLGTLSTPRDAIGEISPVSVTPGKGDLDEVPPVPRVPDGVVGRRAVISGHGFGGESVGVKAGTGRRNSWTEEMDGQGKPHGPDARGGDMHGVVNAGLKNAVTSNGQASDKWAGWDDDVF